MDERRVATCKTCNDKNTNEKASRVKTKRKTKGKTKKEEEGKKGRKRRGKIEPEDLRRNAKDGDGRFYDDDKYSSRIVIRATGKYRRSTKSAEQREKRRI